jgi:hypothetical protein
MRSEDASQEESLSGANEDDDVEPIDRDTHSAETAQKR